jgi:hypothetical protein
VWADFALAGPLSSQRGPCARVGTDILGPLVGLPSAEMLVLRSLVWWQSGNWARMPATHVHASSLPLARGISLSDRSSLPRNRSQSNATLAGALQGFVWGAGGDKVRPRSDHKVGAESSPPFLSRCMLSTAAETTEDRTANFSIPCLFVLLRVDEQVTEDPSVQRVEIAEQEIIEGKLCP